YGQVSYSSSLHVPRSSPPYTLSLHDALPISSTTPFEGDACRIHSSGVPDGFPERSGRTTHLDMIHTAAPVRKVRDGASCRFRSGDRVSDSPASTASSPSSVATPVPRPTMVKVRRPPPISAAETRLRSNPGSPVSPLGGVSNRTAQCASGTTKGGSATSPNTPHSSHSPVIGSGVWMSRPNTRTPATTLIGNMCHR